MNLADFEKYKKQPEFDEVACRSILERIISEEPKLQVHEL